MKNFKSHFRKILYYTLCCFNKRHTFCISSQQDTQSLNLDTNNPATTANLTNSRTLISLDDTERINYHNSYQTNNNNHAFTHLNEHSNKRITPHEMRPVEDTLTLSHPHHTNPQHYGLMHHHPALTHPSLHEDYYTDYGRLNVHHHHHRDAWPIEETHCDTGFNNFRSK